MKQESIADAAKAGVRIIIKPVNERDFVRHDTVGGVMDSWPRQFQQRLDDFGRGRGPGRPVSVKARINSGCFHREHSRHAYKMIDEYVAKHGLDGCKIEEHETGPEVLLWMALGTAGLGIAKSVIDLVTTIIKARAEGIKKGDHPSDPVELIIRDFGPDGKVREERVLRFNPKDPVEAKKIETAMNAALQRSLPPPDLKPAQPQQSQAQEPAVKPKKLQKKPKQRRR